jgi:hypothetical protein
MTPPQKPPIYRTKDYLVQKIFESGIVPGIALFNSREMKFTPTREPLTLPETITKMENQGIDIKKDFKNFLEKIIDSEQLDKNRKTVSLKHGQYTAQYKAMKEKNLEKFRDVYTPLLIHTLRVMMT